ncbi:putative tocopherol O-methyltransferase [Rosa chinensis]|uniref:Putative tocopherol O-methyltransferase n=1 Tax=Rosa chinensis TaxID=74649 RepID=A0A2P6QB27_ROSCH|nr:putative tocopherol O-methyltransferase [Rosa chinensis]
MLPTTRYYGDHFLTLIICRTARTSIKVSFQGSRLSDKCPIGNVVDVGCGIGGSSRYLASKYGANCKGIRLRGPMVLLLLKA